MCVFFRHQLDLVAAVRHPLPGTQLGAFAGLGPTVHAHFARLDLGVRMPARRAQAGHFQYLIELNIVTPDFNT